MDMEFSESNFRCRLVHALAAMRKVLSTNRNPELPSSVPHTYEDKYLFANALTNTYLAASLNCLQFLGLDAEQLAKMQAWASSRSVSLSFSAEETCTFIKKEKRTIEPTSETVHKLSFSGIKSTFSSKTVTTVVEYFWRFECSYRLEVLRGSGRERFTLLEGKGDCELVTQAEEAPHPKRTSVKPRDVQITWLLQQLSPDLVWQFAVDRAAETCHTPRRNEETEAGLSFVTKLAAWASKVETQMRKGYAHIHKKTPMDLTLQGLFCPILPFFEANVPAAAASSGTNLAALPDAPASAAVLPPSDAYAFLEEQQRALVAKEAELAKVAPASGIMTLAEAKLVIAMLHLRDLGRRYWESVEFIESILRSQLVEAIGKEVGAEEFGEYMRFHARKLFKEEFLPKSLCYAVRRPACSPEGVLTVEATPASGKGAAEGITTIVRHAPATHAMSFALNASASVSLMGDRFVHAHIAHQFSGSSGAELSLAARARQFSSFVLLVGTITGANTFDAKHAVIVQNKDEILVPLLLEQIPTAQEFRDAIESLSPEQQRFAKAFRSLQLESTLFAVAVVQIKPALEAVLNLPDDSLTKEIALAEDLLELFIKYQIPSDLLSFDGEEGTSVKGKVACVRRHVDAVKAMIQAQKEEELRILKEKQEAERLARELELRRKMEEESRAAAERTRRRMKEVKEKKDVKYSKAPTKPNKRKDVMMKKGKKGAAPKKKRLEACIASDMSLQKSCAPPEPVFDNLCSPDVATPVQDMVEPARDAQVVDGDGGEAAAVEEVAEVKAEPEEAKGDDREGKEVDGEAEDDGHEDYTKLPVLLDAKFLLLDEDSAVRPTIVKPSPVWSKKHLPSLLAAPQTTNLQGDTLRAEKARAFDLLDALTKSGALCVRYASVHVLMIATHCFDKTLLDTLIQDNVNPIEKVEKSVLIMAATVHGRPAEELILPSRVEAAKAASPALFSA